MIIGAIDNDREFQLRRCEIPQVFLTPSRAVKFGAKLSTVNSLLSSTGQLPGGQTLAPFCLTPERTPELDL